MRERCNLLLPDPGHLQQKKQLSVYLICCSTQENWPYTLSGQQCRANPGGKGQSSGKRTSCSSMPTHGRQALFPAPCPLPLVAHRRTGPEATRARELCLRTVGPSFTLPGQSGRAGPAAMGTGEPAQRARELESWLCPLPSVALGEPARTCPGGVDAGAVAG